MKVVDYDEKRNCQELLNRVSQVREADVIKLVLADENWESIKDSNDSEFIKVVAGHIKNQVVGVILKEFKQNEITIDQIAESFYRPLDFIKEAEATRFGIIEEQFMRAVLSKDSNTNEEGDVQIDGTVHKRNKNPDSPKIFISSKVLCELMLYRARFLGQINYGRGTRNWGIVLTTLDIPGEANDIKQSLANSIGQDIGDYMVRIFGVSIKEFEKLDLPRPASSGFEVGYKIRKG